MKNYSKLKELKILYVEDEKNARQELSDMLLLTVGKVFEAKNGQEGFDIYKENKPDIIITDINMPVLDGIEMINLIRKVDKEIIIVVISAYNESKVLTKAIDLHVDKYIIKPFDINELLNTLNNAAQSIIEKKELWQKEIILKNKERINAIEDLLENIAHHWRQPLSVITTSISALRIGKEMNALTDKAFFETCDIIHDNAQELSKTINDFKNSFSSSEQKEKLNLNDIIKKYIELIKISFDKRGIKIITKLNNIELEIAKSDILQVISILINNSKDALTKSTLNNKIVFVELDHDNKNTFLKITDNAGGIEEENINRIFEPYFTTKHSYSGTGLGLYILHEVVKNSIKGSVEVKNSFFNYEGTGYKGAEFKIIL